MKTPEITLRNPQNTGLLCIKHRMFVAETSELSIEEVRCFPVSARHFSRKSPKIPRFCPEIPILHPLAPSIFPDMPQKNVHSRHTAMGKYTRNYQMNLRLQGLYGFGVSPKNIHTDYIVVVYHPDGL